MFNTLADVPQPIAAYYEEVEADGVTAVQLKPWGEVRSWQDVELVIELCKPAEVYAKFVAMAVQGEHKAFHDSYIEWLEECAEIDEWNSGTYLDEDGQLQLNEQRSYSEEPMLLHRDYSDLNEEHFKSTRAEIVLVLTVEVDGMVFDANETAQTRMTRAIVGLDEATDTINWRLYDNTVQSVTRAQLKQALVLAGQAQTAVWFPAT